MDDQAQAFYELRFQTAFLETKGAAFQDLFARVMAKAYPGDFIACRPWGNTGDRKNDGYLKSERTLFQVYAPNEMRVAEAVRKITEDFTGAIPYWQEYFDRWVFVHNASGGLAPDIIAALLELERQHVPITVASWGYDELLLRFRRLSLADLSSLYGALPTARASARQKKHAAQEHMRNGQHDEAMREMADALAIAREDKEGEEEVEILSAMALYCSSRNKRHDRQDYFRQAEKKAAQLKSPAARAIYLRAHAAALEEQRDWPAAETAYREALLHCTTAPEDDKGNLASQGCVVRSSLVHFLCNQKRSDEARPLLAECETFAREHKDNEDGELFEAALEAGIHLSLETADEDGALARIEELERFATTSRVAHRIGGSLLNIANEAVHRKAQAAATAASTAAVRLARRSDDGSSPNLLVGALYTEAMVIGKGGHDDKTALAKAEALLDLCRDEADAPVKEAAHHPIAELRRLAGDSQTAVNLARQTLAETDGGPENVAFSKLALARALNDNGPTQEPLQHAKEAWVLLKPTSTIALPAAVVDVLSHITNYASQLGMKDDILDAVHELEAIKDVPDDVQELKKQAFARIAANWQLRQRFLAVLDEPDPATLANTKRAASLSEANAAVTRPLLRLWKELPGSITASYDFWGRGNFERVLLNTRRFPNSFNITLEVRTLDDIKRAIRLWALYADFLLLLWKGPMNSGVAVTSFPADYTDRGGWGYTICGGDPFEHKRTKQKRHPAIAYTTLLPEDVAAFLANEARPFIHAGRLLLVPAAGVGCVNPGHGPFEQLLAEAANAIPSIRWKGGEGMPIGQIPHSPSAPFTVLAELIEKEAARLRKLRLLLLRRTKETASDLEAKTLALEIDDALREMQDRHATFARRKNLDRASEPVARATARFKTHDDGSPYAPLLVLQNLGYGWRVDSPQVLKIATRFEPGEDDVIGTWLAPPSSGWRFTNASIVKAKAEEADESTAE